VLVWPVRVQGETSAAEVAAAIAGFNALEPGGPVPRPDVLIVARGGGSLEDLWSFNEEIVVRAAAMSEIPLISAVGHETDTTLIDFAADVRAPTPTAAAEMAVPVRADLLAAVRTHGARMTGAMARGLDRRRTEMRSAARALPGAEGLLAIPRQRVDLAALRLGSLARAGLDRRRQGLLALARRLQGQTPEARLARFGERIAGLGARLKGAQANLSARRNQAFATLTQRLTRALDSRLALASRDLLRRREQVAVAGDRLLKAALARQADRQRRLANLAALFNSLGYRQVLARGFALVRDGQGRPVRQAGEVTDHMGLEIEFADGRVQATAGESGRKARPAKPHKPEPGGQGSLF
jgi:exodeoxyribonuclease VII large subunit